MKIIKLISIFILLSTLVLPALSQTNQEKDVIFRAVEDEMERAMKDLKFNSFDKPYFLEYVVEDTEILSIQSTFGAIRNSSIDKTRTLFTQVRVGNYELDNAGEYSFRVPFPMPLDDDYEALRRSVWFVTDSAYKQAINVFELVKASKENETEDEDEKVDSFSKEKPTVYIEKRKELVVDKKKWEDKVRDWSLIFRQHPEFRDSTFNFYINQTNRYLINSEGTRILKPQMLITLDIHASADLSDNSTLAPYRHIFATDLDETLNTEQVKKEIESLAEDVKKYNSATQFKETYIGPAIFTERASVQLFLELLIPNLSGEEFTDRIGRKVLPSFLSVVDDPTLTTFGDLKLKGDYKIDAEGVYAKPLTLIENGVLKTVLTTRSPIKAVPNSNGRARSISSRGSEPNISNLIIKSKDGKSFEELKKQLIEECKKQDLPYGIIFRENSDTFSTYNGSAQILGYKVYVKDGREELFNGAGIYDLSVRELRNILAAGDDSYLYNLLVNSSYDGTGTPASIVTPSVLFEEIYLKKSSSRREKPNLLPHPFFAK